MAATSRRALWGVLAVAAAALVPAFLSTPYFLRVLTVAGLFVILAVSYDLVVGQVGAFSLAHPAFYGIGAYTVAILVTKAHWSYGAAFAAAAVVAAVIAVVIGFPAFRLQERSFAIGTLGMLMVLQLVATNWIDVTGGPMCILGVPPLQFGLPFGLRFSTAALKPALYGALVLAVAAYALVGVVSGSRVGRAFRAIRENEVLAEQQGIHSLYYKLLAFGIGAGIAGVAGGYYASWSSLVCPGEMSLSYTTTLLIIVFVGGVGSLRGVTLGAIFFTVLPELLRASAAARLVIYGLILLLGALYLPDGFEGLLRRGETAWAKRRRPADGGDNP